MKPTPYDRMAWNRMLWLLGIVASLVLAAACFPSDAFAGAMVARLTEMVDRDLLAIAAARFPHYANLPAAILGIGMAWLTAPLTVWAGWLFSARAISQHILATHRGRSHLMKFWFVLVALGIAAMAVFADIALPGGGTALCRGCEDRSMLFMLAIRVAGFWVAGVMLGVAWLLVAHGMRGEGSTDARSGAGDGA
jgi:hypothetical protein